MLACRWIGEQCDPVKPARVHSGHLNILSCSEREMFYPVSPPLDTQKDYLLLCFILARNCVDSNLHHTYDTCVRSSRPIPTLVNSHTNSFSEMQISENWKERCSNSILFRRMPCVHKTWIFSHEKKPVQTQRIPIVWNPCAFQYIRYAKHWRTHSRCEKKKTTRRRRTNENICSRGEASSMHTDKLYRWKVSRVHLLLYSFVVHCQSSMDVGVGNFPVAHVQFNACVWLCERVPIFECTVFVSISSQDAALFCVRANLNRTLGYMYVS